MNMTLTQVIQILGIAEGQQISDEVSEAIRTVLAEMQKPEKDVVEVVRCRDCKESEYRSGKRYCYLWDYEPGMSPNTVDEDDFCSYGKRK